MAKNFGKFLLGTAIVSAAVAGGVAYFHKCRKNDESLDDDFDDFQDEFDDEDLDEEPAPSREYVTIPKEPKPEEPTADKKQDSAEEPASDECQSSDEEPASEEKTDFCEKPEFDVGIEKPKENVIEAEEDKDADVSAAETENAADDKATAMEDDSEDNPVVNDKSSAE